MLFSNFTTVLWLNWATSTVGDAASLRPVRFAGSGVHWCRTGVDCFQPCGCSCEAMVGQNPSSKRLELMAGVLMVALGIWLGLQALAPLAQHRELMMDFPLLISTFLTVFLANSVTRLNSPPSPSAAPRPPPGGLSWILIGAGSCNLGPAGGQVHDFSDLLQLVASLGFLVIGGRLLVPLFREAGPAAEGDQTPELVDLGLTPHGL